MGVDTKLEWNGDKKKKDINQGTIRALIRAGELVKSSAKSLAPVDTGHLRGSIYKRLIKSKLTENIYTDLEYSPFVEFGTGRFAENGGGRSTPWFYVNAKGEGVWTSGMKPQPFMRPALNDNKDKIKKIFTIEESKAVDK